MKDILMMQAAMSGNREAQKRFFGDAPRLEYPEHDVSPVSVTGGVRSNSGKLFYCGGSEIKAISFEPSTKPLLVDGEIDEKEFEARMLAATMKEQAK